MAFFDAIRDGRVYVCISCDRKLFKEGVTKQAKDWKEKLEMDFPDCIDKIIGPIKEHKVSIPVGHNLEEKIANKASAYICHHCKIQ